jgi:hypothetical protein
MCTYLKETIKVLRKPIFRLRTCLQNWLPWLRLYMVSISPFGKYPNSTSIKPWILPCNHSQYICSYIWCHWKCSEVTPVPKKAYFEHTLYVLHRLYEFFFHIHKSVTFTSFCVTKSMNTKKKLNLEDLRLNRKVKYKPLISQKIFSVVMIIMLMQDILLILLLFILLIIGVLPTDWSNVLSTVVPWIASNVVCECFARRAKILNKF